MTLIPEIETERLRLRPMMFADWPDYAALMASDRARFMGGPHAAADAWGMFCHDVANWQLFGHGALMVDEKDAGLCVGQVGINHGPLFPEKELGWFVYPTGEGRGYAFEAASAFRDWAFATLGLQSLVSYMDPENERSRRLAERMGAFADPEAMRPEPQDLVYRHLNKSP